MRSRVALRRRYTGSQRQVFHGELGKAELRQPGSLEGLYQAPFIHCYSCYVTVTSITVVVFTGRLQPLTLSLIWVRLRHQAAGCLKMSELINDKGRMHSL